MTAHPNAKWLARRLTEACGWDEAPRDLIRDRDGAYGAAFIRRIRAMGIRDRPVSARSPWKGVVAAGVAVMRVEVDINGRIVVIAGKPSDAPAGNTPEDMKRLL